MMEKSREARFQSVLDFAHALEDLRGHAAAYEAARVERAASGHSGHTMIIEPHAEARATMRVDVGQTPATGAFAASPPPSPSPPATPSGGFAQPHLPPSGGYPQATGPSSGPQPIMPPSGAYPQPIMPPTGGFGAPPYLPSSGGYPASPSGGYPASPSGGYPAAPSTAPAAGAPGAIPYASYNPRAGCSALIEDPRHAAFARTLMSRQLGRWFEVSELCLTAGVAMPATLPLDLGLFVSWLEHPYPDPGVAAVVFLSLRSGWSTVVLCARVR